MIFTIFKVPQKDTECNLLLCKHCQKCIKQFRKAFVRFVECTQEGVDKQLGELNTGKDLVHEESTKTDNNNATDSSESIGTSEENQKEDDLISIASEDAKELAHHDSSHLSEDSMTAELTKSKSEVDILATHEELSVISSIDHLDADVLDKSSEKALEVGVNGHQKVENQPKAIVDYSDSDNSESIDDKPKHDQKDTPTEDHKCKICGKQNETVYVLNRHIAGFHLKLNRVTCDLCHLTFANRNSLKVHMKFRHKVKLVKETAIRHWLRCKHCAQHFNTARELTAHYESIAMADMKQKLN